MVMVSNSARARQPGVDRLFAQFADLCRFAMKARAERGVMRLDEAIRRERDAPSKRMLSERERIDDPYTGAAYAARVAAEAMIAAGGFDLLELLHDRIEREVGGREAEWLSRRWTGIAGPDGACWPD